MRVRIWRFVEGSEDAGVNPGDSFKDVPLRISTCSDAKLLTQHGWKEHFEAEVTTRRRDGLRNKWLPGAWPASKLLAPALGGILTVPHRGLAAEPERIINT